ncbi:MAG: hypothetical protein M3135_04605, partial [Actinomycetota bacterium]|nr:hypothetical protein [Actinomycetota bacterium]
MKRPIRIILLAFAAAAVSPAPAGAGATCQVPSGTYPTIQDAVNDPNCTTIELAGQTFNEDVMIDRSVTILGEGSAATVIDGTGSNPTVQLSTGSPRTLSMSGLTVTGGGGINCAGFL